MIPTEIEGATRRLGAPRNWKHDQDGDCGQLTIVDVELDGGTPAMVSTWQPSPGELAALNSGSPIYLRVVGNVHPPVMVWVPCQ